MRFASLIIASVALALLSACPGPKPAKQGGPIAAGDVQANLEREGSAPVRILADKTLAGVLKALEPGYSQAYNDGWQIKTLERGQLLLQIDGKFDCGPDWGKDPTQVYLLADKEVFDSLRARKMMDEGSVRTFAGDRLVIVSRAKEKWVPASVFDLGSLRFKALGLGDPEATALGYYGKQALVSDGAFKGLEPRIKLYPTGSELIAALTEVKDEKVKEAERGEVQLEVLFASLAAQTEMVKVVYLIDEDLSEPVRYQAVAASGHGADPGVAELLRYLAEDEAAQAMLESYGYVTRAKVLAPPKDPGLNAPADPAGTK